MPGMPGGPGGSCARGFSPRRAQQTRPFILATLFAQTSGKTERYYSGILDTERGAN